MVQLKVYDGSDQYFLDLLSTDPIKLTLSIEDITNADARSTFSRTFRVPSTLNNNQFFKNAFLVDGIDYDVTVKKRAEILYNGAEYKVGHIRLQKIYVNKMERNTEYEIVFLGETRDFASAIGEKTLADLDLSMYNHDLTYANISKSWEAWPSAKKADNTPITPSLTNGLFSGVIYTNPFGEQIDLGGDILYPLINFGEDENTDVVIAANTNSGYFGHGGSNGSINVNRFKPMIRAKAIWDRIFEQAGFEYESAIADAPDFKQLYISAFGNEASIIEEAGSANLLNVALTTDWYYDEQIGGFQVITWDDEITDPSNNYSPVTGKYVVPTSVSGTDNEGNYEFDIIVDGAACLWGNATVTSAIRIYDASSNTTSTSYVQSTSLVPSGMGPSGECESVSYSHAHQFTEYLQEGDQVWVVIQFSAINPQNIEFGAVTDNISKFQILDAPGGIGISPLLDNDYKQIDFIKDIITKFRLVMSPDKINPKKFIVEPWTDYIGTGDIHDWSHKLDESKDISLEPLFFTQSARLEFTDKEDADWLNELNLKKYKETFGTLKIDSGNELLKGTREVKTNFAPTPITQIENAPFSNFVIPRLYSRDVDNQSGTVTDRTPIKPVTRLLFYNGVFEIGPASALPNNFMWYVNEETAPGSGVYNYYTHAVFPMVSYWQTFDATTGPGAATVNLNWQIERGYTNDVASPYNFNWTNGISMYNRFWKSYIESLYNKYARRFTGYFSLSVEDLFNFSFDDVIFVNGAYYRPEKLTDVIVGQKSLVKVDLIKLLDYGLAIGTGDSIPTPQPEPPVYTTNDVFWYMTPCDGGTTLVVGPPNPLATAGQVATINGICYTFDSSFNWSQGLTIDATRDNNTYYPDCITCKCDNAAPLTILVQPSTASSAVACDGDITVTISGGVAPYSTTLTGPNGYSVTDTTDSPSFNNLCCGDYTATTTDACGTVVSELERVLCGPDGPSGPSN